MTNIRKQCLLILAAIVCVAAMPFHATTASDASPQAGDFADAMLEVGKARWEREGRTNAREFTLVTSLAQTANLALAAPSQTVAVPQGPQGPGGDPTPIETMGGATQCPVTQTTCPVEVTACPESFTTCPATPTLCVQTTCPVIPTHCPAEATVCETTECPANATYCPTVPTQCPAIPTACPAGFTSCPVEATRCPTDPTVCTYETNCPDAITICSGSYTTCPYEATRCDWTSTQCNHPACTAGGYLFETGPTIWIESEVAPSGVLQVARRMIIGSPAPVRTFI